MSMKKRFLLWLVLVVQLCILACVWLLQANYVPLNTPTIEFTGASASNEDIKVKFILLKSTKVGFTSNSTNVQEQWTPTNRINDDFFKKIIRLNYTGYEDVNIRNEQREEEFWCFREGSNDEFETHGQADAEKMPSTPSQCKCMKNWHGRDCGQPEAIWRALLASKIVLTLLQPPNTEAHRLVFMLEGTFINLDFFELQVRSVADVVDYFFIYMHSQETASNNLKFLQQKLEKIFQNSVKYMLISCDQLTRIQLHCTTRDAFKYFKEQFSTLPMKLEENDLFLYINDPAIVSRSILKFLIYYAADIQLLRFRMKYNIYGFYWQHPNRTQLSGIVSSLKYLHNPMWGNDDPRNLLYSIERLNNTTLIVGDLNHYAGWFCQYCAQPEQIISELYMDTSSLTHVRFPNDTKNHLIDSLHVQKLIANGIYVDGKTQLLRMRKSSDIYYAPNVAERNNWKYSNILTNLYEKFDDVISEEEYI